MSMHQGIDLSRFKKVSSDEKSSVLRHAKGHEIRIAHKALTPAMREQIEALPKHMAEGGDVDEDTLPPKMDSTLASRIYQSEVPPPQVAMVTPQIQRSESANSATPEELETLKATLASPQQPAAVPEVPQEQVSQTPAQPQMQLAEPTQRIQTAAPTEVLAPPPIDQQLKQEDQHFANDLNQGHIQPKTLHDLFAKKDTLGKIGTLFGLMIGGAGAGLSHQPNALLEMMNKEITDDLEAQKVSAGNRQNFVKMNMEHQMQVAQIEHMRKQGVLNDAQTKVALSELGIKADALSRMQMNRAALHSLVQNVNKLPIGSPQRAQAEQQLAMLNQGVQNENFNLADRAATASASMNLMYGGNQNQVAGSDPDESFRARQRMLHMNGNADLAKDEASRYIPTVGMAAVPLAEDDKKAVRSGMMFKNELQRFIDWTEKHSGDVSPTERNKGEVMAKELQSSYRAAIEGGVFKKGEQEFIDGIIDSNPTKFFNEIRVLPQLHALREGSDHKLNDRLRLYGINGLPNQANASSGNRPPGGGSVDGATGTYKGQPVVMRGGKWVYSGTKGVAANK